MNIIQRMIRIFNAYSRKKEIFKPIRPKKAGLYACGPTVYDFAHIGNLRTYIFEDILRRTLERSAYKVKHVMNITDIDDKIIQGAQKSGRDIFEFTKPYESAFFSDLKKLNIKKAWKYPKATEHIKEMVSLINILLQKKIAYLADDGVYFSIAKFKSYGKLSGTAHLKENAQDFVLWKFKKPNEPSWKAPFGEGRPGWHIECSAMSMKYLGHTFDIHVGAVDLIFPHHENEIAQSESATEKKFVNYFLEGEHLLVSGEKMSKSLGNIFTLRDIEEKNMSSLAYRYFVLGAHYRSKLNFTWEALLGAQKALEKLYEFIKKLKGQGIVKKGQGLPLNIFRSKFNSALYDDLNTPKALAVLWNLIHSYNKNYKKFNAREVLGLIYEFDEVLGLEVKQIKRLFIPKEIFELAQKREEFRKQKNWSKSDEIRKKIQKKGYLIEDTKDGPKLSPTSALSG